MSKDIFDKYADTNGFVRMAFVPPVRKFFRLLDGHTITTPEDPHDAPYKVKGHSKSVRYGEYDFIAVSEAEMFARRVLWRAINPGGWYMQSEMQDNGKRTNKIMFIYNISYVQMFEAPMRFLKVEYYDLTGNFNFFTISSWDIKRLVLRRCDANDLEIIGHFQKMRALTPDPSRSIMRITSDYQSNYSKYKRECKRWGFNPLRKDVMNILSLDEPQFTDKEGRFTSYDSDCEIINDRL